MNGKVNSSFKKKVYRANRLARYIISFGGYSIIISIVAILLFLFYQSLPLSFGASIKKLFTFEIPSQPSRVLLVGADQYQEIFYYLTGNGEIHFYRFSDQNLILTDSIQLLDGEKLFCASKGRLGGGVIALGTNLGRIISAEIKFRSIFEELERRIVPRFLVHDSFEVEVPSDSIPAHIEKLVFRKTEDGHKFYAWVNHRNELKLNIFDSDEEKNYRYNLSKYVDGIQLTRLTMSYNGESLIAGSKLGELFFFDLSDFEEVSLKDNWKASQSPISAIGFLIGSSSLVVCNISGNVSVWFPVRNENDQFKFTQISRIQPHLESVTQIYSSPRNRSFLTIDAGGAAHLNFSTTGETQLKFKPAKHKIQTAAFTPKSDGIVLVNGNKQFAQYHLENEHPETTLKTLFGKVWYEGYSETEFVWQSTGGTDEFESKLSLIPLIFGTLKGTFYALFFSIPLAILAAIYVSQFSPKWLSRMVKPTVEIMAALPSVVIGFLAGLYFSPLFERHLMTVFLILIFLPVVFIVGVGIWRLVPEEKRMLVPVGWELIFVLPLVFLAFWLASAFSHIFELWFFAGDLTQWIYESLGLNYDQRNSLVVGFALGFAVVPIIFTISEDSLSNVPESLTSASLALGASRWQTVRKVVLPAAAGGIFAAIMLGLGRAIGETMIVLMATGNTPILDFSPFNGFRAMSACIAVEIPEAPVGGTLYRVLFLTAFLLFIFTFVINSLGAIIGDRLRKKYARF